MPRRLPIALLALAAVLFACTSPGTAPPARTAAPVPTLPSPTTQPPPPPPAANLTAATRLALTAAPTPTIALVPPTVAPNQPVTIVPPIRTVTADNLPAIAEDLLFTSQGNLMRWDHQTGKIVTVFESGKPENRGSAFFWQPSANNYASYTLSMSADGSKILMARRLVDGTSELGYLESASRQFKGLVRLQPQAPDGTGFQVASISPDGRWVSFMALGNLLDERTHQPIPTPASPANNEEGTNQAKIYLAPVNGSARPRAVGACQAKDPCELLWSPGDQVFAWTDQRGIWISGPEQHEARLVLPQKLDAQGWDIRAYSAESWSPLGRYLLVRIGYFEGSATGVLDGQNERVEKVPGSDFYVGPYASLIWMKDERIFMVSPSMIDTTTGKPLPPSGSIWSIHPDDKEMLAVDEQFAIPAPAESFPCKPAQLQDERLAFALFNPSPDNYQDRGLYALDLKDTNPHKLNGLPPTGEIADDGFYNFSADLLWSPTGEAIFQDWNTGTLLYAPSDGSALYDLSTGLAKDPGGFTWLK